MNTYNRLLINKYKVLLQDRQFLFSAILALGMLCVAFVINYYAGNYADSRGSNPVTDIVLSNVRVFDLDGLIIYSTLFFGGFIALFCLMRPEIMPFTVKSIVLFILIRSAFISMTHIGPFPSSLILDSKILSTFTFSGDLFFSGHTGLPFLMALIFWRDNVLRYFFIVCSIFFGTIMLLAHLHYSIDVLGAFFITYTIYHIAEVLFKKDKIFLEHERIKAL